MNYANKINKLIADINASGDHDISGLARALGCARFEWRPKAGYQSIQVRQPSEINEPKVVETLVHLARWSLSNQVPSTVSNLEILDGLVRHGRWRACVTSGSDAAALCYILLVMVAHINVLRSDNDTAWWSVAEPVVCNLLNAWVAPVEPYVEVPSEDALAAALFGDVWVDLARAVADGTEFAQLFATLRPPVLERLLQGPQEILGSDRLDLPELDAGHA